MVFGEFEWQTEELINQQINVNLAGYMRVAKAFCPLLRQYKGKVCNKIHKYKYKYKYINK